MEMPKEIAGGFRARPRDAHKRSVGTVTVVGGSHGFPHAPVIAGLGARAAGAGLVRLVVPTESRCAAGALLPEATVSDLGGEIPHSDVAVVGPGLGLGEAARLAVRGLLSGGGRLVVDADALTHLAAICGDGGDRDGGAELILTPHEGEAARLLGVDCAEVSSGRIAAAKEIARRYRATVVLKGPGTLVVSPGGERVYENPTGNPFMALGGMGDLLSGVVAKELVVSTLGVMYAPEAEDVSGDGDNTQLQAALSSSVSLPTAVNGRPSWLTRIWRFPKAYRHTW